LLVQKLIFVKNDNNNSNNNNNNNNNNNKALSQASWGRLDMKPNRNIRKPKVKEGKE